MKTGGWDGIVDIVAHCGLNGPGFESVGVTFSGPIQTSSKALPGYNIMGTGSLWGRRSGWGIATTTHPYLV